MIDYFENDYALPVVLGSSSDELYAARIIKRQCNKKTHVFSQRLSLLNKIKYSFHKLPRSSRFWVASLKDFATSIHEYYTPILIYGKDFSSIIAENLSELESLFIIIPANEIKYHLNDTSEESK